MRVLHVLGELRSSGAEVRLLHALPYFIKANVEQVMLSTGATEGEFAKQYRDAGMDVCHLPFERKARYLLNFYRLVKQKKIDIVHIHAERANFVLGMSARAARVGVVRTICSNFSYEAQLRAIRKNERRLLRILGVRHVSIGPSVEKNEEERLRNPTTLVDNWIGPDFRPPNSDERLAARTAYGVPQEAIVIATVGNCAEVKNHQAVVEALGLLAGRVSQPLIYLHAGHGSMEPQERALARNLHEVAEIRFLGTVKDVRELLWASDIYCMPSLYEGVGNAALEAIACGVPAVLSQVPGLVDVAEPSAGVQFVEPTATGMATGIAGLLQDLGAARANVAEVARRVAAERSGALAVRKLVEIYRSV